MLELINSQWHASKCVTIDSTGKKGTLDFQFLPISMVLIFSPWLISSYQCGITELSVEKGLNTISSHELV